MAIDMEKFIERTHLDKHFNDNEIKRLINCKNLIGERAFDFAFLGCIQLNKQEAQDILYYIHALEDYVNFLDNLVDYNELDNADSEEEA